MADNELHRMMGSVQAGIEHLKGSVSEIKTECRENADAISSMAGELGKLNMNLQDVKTVADDWAATKKRGLVVLAGVGATGLAAGYGFKPGITWIKAVLFG